MHTLKYMRLKISLNPRSSVRLRPFKALKKLFDLHRKKTCESSAKMNISNPNTNSAPLPWHVSLALLDPCWTSLSATSTQGAQGCLGQHLLAWAFVPLWCALCFFQGVSCGWVVSGGVGCCRHGCRVLSGPVGCCPGCRSVGAVGVCRVCRVNLA